jgi:hypothetical protein
MFASTQDDIFYVGIILAKMLLVMVFVSTIKQFGWS